MDASPKDNGQPRSACTECQRRKQKCNREWPCNHCQKRKVADRCHFSQTTQAAAAANDRAAANQRKRNRGRDDHDSDDDSDDDDDVDDFEALGYTSAHFFTNLQPNKEKKPKPPVRQYYVAASACPQLERALQVLPPRTTTDSLVQNFLSRVNFHYYIIYPSSFLQEYREWWQARYAEQPLGLQWTCLLLTICACSAQYTEPDLERKLKLELGQSVDRLSNLYHNTARELHGVVPVGNNHILNVQHLLHSCYWYKSEARFVESWHVLSAAIREAQALGMHQDKLSSSLSEFDCEMRRRLWCVLDTWDWQISALLSRPKVIDRTECSVSLPTLTLEGHSPSPLLHTKLQSELIGRLSRHFGSPREVRSPAQVEQYMKTVHDWIQEFPKVYNIDNPDTSVDSRHSWVTLHRHYLHTMAYSMMLDPMRAYLAKRMTHDSPPQELRLRSHGIHYALKLMDSLYGFFDHVYPRDAKFHWVLFSIFDTAAVLCSAILHDEDQTMQQRRDEITVAIESALSMLQRLASVTRAAKTSYDILLRLSKRVENPYQRPSMSPDYQSKRSKVSDDSLTPPFIAQTGEISLGSSEFGSTDGYDAQDGSPLGSGFAPSVAGTSPGYGPPTYIDTSGSFPVPTTMSTAMDSSQLPYTMPPHTGAIADNVLMPAPPNPYMPPTPRGSYANMTFDGFSEEQLGDLASLWNYQSLDLSFVPNQRS